MSFSIQKKPKIKHVFSVFVVDNCFQRFCFQNKEINENMLAIFDHASKMGVFPFLLFFFGCPRFLVSVLSLTGFLEVYS